MVTQMVQMRLGIPTPNSLTKNSEILMKIGRNCQKNGQNCQKWQIKYLTRGYRCPNGSMQISNVKYVQEDRDPANHVTTRFAGDQNQ